MIGKTYRYRLTQVVTYDYGNSQYTEGSLSIVPDGSFCRDRPAMLKIGVEHGRRPGAIFEVSIREQEPTE